MTSANDPNTFIGADNQIADLLAAPFIRDAHNIVWYAAGRKNTWLCITKTDGQADIVAFERDKMAFEQTEIPLEEFAHRNLRPDPADALGLTEDLSRNHYAVSQLAMANLDAWRRNDWKMHRQTLALLAQHVPSVADVCERAKTLALIEARPDYDFAYTVGYALDELDAIEALADDPKGAATLDPWFRAQQLVRVASKAQPDTVCAREPKLYVFESEDEKSFLLVQPEANDECPEFNMWLDEAMTPLLIDYRKNSGVSYLNKPGYTWELKRPLPGTISGWNNAMASMGSINAAPFESLKTGAMRALTPQENLDAIQAWASNPQPMAAWSDDIDGPRAIMYTGQWALSTWTKANPQSGQLLQSLLPEIDLNASPSQFDAWRQMLVMAASNNALLPADNIDLSSIISP